MDTLKKHGLIPHSAKEPSVGQRFSRLTVLAIGKKASTYRYLAVCLCDCGNEIVTRIDRLQIGHTQSCGCLHEDSVTKHGLYAHPLYGVWKQLMSRCYKPSDKRYERYGGRGITVCRRWHSVENFIEDMEPTYKPSLQIERKRNNENYEPSNCTWATHTEQQRNRSNNINITIGRETKVLAEWCVIYGIRYQLAWERITKQGWTPIDALTRKAGE